MAFGHLAYLYFTLSLMVTGRWYYRSISGVLVQKIVTSVSLMNDVIVFCNLFCTL